MLSAVAARKAALEAQKKTEPPEIPSESHTAIPIIPKKAPKRKLVAQKARPETKKSRKVNGVRPAPKEKHVDEFIDQTDMIIVDSDDESSDSVLNTLNDFGHEPPARRAWSPSQPVEDSSDEESPDGETLPFDMSSLFPSTSNPQKQADDTELLSTFEPVIDENVFFLNETELAQFGLSDPTTLVSISAGDTICLLGTCKLAVLQGTLSLTGTTLSVSRTQHTIFAPRSSPLPILHAGKQSSSISLLSRSKLSPRLQRILESETVISIQENWTGVEGLGRICRTFEGVFEPSRWQKSSTTAPFKIPGIFMITRPSKESHAFALPPSWCKALNDVPVSDGLSDIYIIKGPKNSGKSTFARTLMNHLLGSYRHVAYLECDIGQSEFTPGGMVSLNIISSPVFGPSFTHPTLPNHAHFIGSTTPRSNPSHYLDAVQALIQTYRMDIQTPAIEMTDNEDPRIQDTIPLVVNSMGWSKGLGADLNQNIESLVDANHIYDVQAPVREEYPMSVPAVPMGSTYGAYSSHLTTETTAAIHILEPITSFSTVAGYTAADHRTLSILSYFHAKFPLDAVPGELGQITARSWDTARPLCAIPPYEIDCAVALDKVVLTGSGTEDVVEDEIGRVLNGAIVGLVTCEAGTIDLGAVTSAGIPYTRQHLPPSPAASTCVGIALVRGVSPPRTTETSAVTTNLQMLTPLPHPLLAGARVLVKGEMELPVWGMLDFRNFNGGKEVDPGDVAGVERDKVPFLLWGKASEGVVGAEKRRVRRNLMRRGQM